MGETISLDFVGHRLTAMQSQLYAQQIEIELTRKELARFAGAMITREMLSEVVQVLAGRIGAFEALIDTRMMQVEGRMDRLESRIGRLETTVESGIAGLHRSNQDVIQLLTRVLAQRPEEIGRNC
jgi:hypothetical protein